MKHHLERVLVVQSQAELRSYTSALLADLGFRHVLQAETYAQAEMILATSEISKKKVQLVVFDDSIPEGALTLQSKLSQVPYLVISDAENPRNLRVAARLGVNSLIFRPYGKEQLARAIQGLV